MRVLMLTPSLPYPPHQGGAIRNYGLMRGLHEAGHTITLLSFHGNGALPDNSPLAEVCAQIETVSPPARSRKERLRDLFLSGRPDLARRLESSQFRRRLEELLAQSPFDLVQLEGLEMASYLPLIRARQPKAKVCYDAHNAEHALQRAIFHVERRNPRRLPAALYSLAQARRIRRFEREVCAEVDCVIAVSDEDADALRPFRADRKIAVVPNGIFTSDYQNDQPRLDLGANVLVFTGKMDYRPNVDAMRWFAESILPQIRERIADVKLYIVGQKPHGSLEALRVQQNIEITGWVADVQPFLQAADVYIAPLRVGSGTRLKILEAMAAGCAVVATSIAASGLKLELRKALVTADDEMHFADAVVALLSDPARRQTLGAAGQAGVRAHYDWSALVPCLLQTYEGIGLE